MILRRDLRKANRRKVSFKLLSFWTVFIFFQFLEDNLSSKKDAGVATSADGFPIFPILKTDNSTVGELN